MPLVARVLLVLVIGALLLAPGLLFAIAPRRLQEWELKQLERHRWWVLYSEKRAQKLRNPTYPRIVRIGGILMIALSLVIIVGILVTSGE